MPIIKKKKKLLNLFVKVLMVSGKRDQAEAKFFGMARNLKSLMKIKAKKVLRGSMENVRPLVAIKTVKVAGRRVRVPYRYPAQRSVTTVLKWLKESGSSERKIEEGLTKEIIQGYLKSGDVYEKMKNLLDLGISNRFALRFVKPRKAKRKGLKRQKNASKV